MLLATWRNEPWWRLTKEEANDLADALAHAIESMPEKMGAPVKAFFMEWSPYIGCLLAYQVVIEPRVRTSQLKGPRRAAGHSVPALRAMPGGRVADPEARVPPQAPEQAAPETRDAATAVDPTPDAIPIPETRPGSLKAQHDNADAGLPFDAAQL